MGDSIKNSKTEILIVEDSATQLEELRYILEKKGYIVDAVTNGREAMDFLKKKQPALVISDVIMPEMDGYELCKKIKSDEQLKKIPVLLLTTLSDPDDVVRGLDCGADNFLTKPYEEVTLISRIEYIILNIEVRKSNPTDIGIEIVFGGKKQYITSSRIQILDMLISTYETAIQKNRELEKANKELREANEKIKTLSGLVPICSICKKIRDDEGYWNQVEHFISQHSDLTFTHGYCPTCAADVLDQVKNLKKRE